MTRRKRAAAGLATVALAVAGVLYVVQPAAVEMCVQVWEDAGAQGDTWTKCATPATLKVANLEAITTGLHGGCNRGINQSSSWTDCISSAKVHSQPGNQRTAFYQNTSYTGTRVGCIDANGTTGPFDFGGGSNDVISSFRVEGGNC